MSVLYLSPEAQAKLILYALCIGAVLGVIGNVFDLISGLTNAFLLNKFARKAVTFVFDIAYSLFCTLVIVIYIYGANDGEVRFFLILFFTAGFALYKLTLGRLLNKLNVKAVNLLKKAISALYNQITKLFKPLKELCDDKSVKKHILKRIDNA